jgi:hypothetical protein
MNSAKMEAKYGSQNLAITSPAWPSGLHGQTGPVDSKEENSDVPEAVQPFGLTLGLQTTHKEAVRIAKRVSWVVNAACFISI